MKKMKKRIGFLLLAALLLMTMSFNVSAVLRQKQAKVSYGTAVIDGVMDDIYKNSDAMTIEYMSSLANSGTEADIPRMATGVMHLAWDENAIYIYCEVKDSTPPKNPLKDPSTDGIECFFDFENVNTTDPSPIGRVGNYGELGAFLKTAAYAQTLGAPELEMFWVANFSTFVDEFLVGNADNTVKCVITSTGYIIERKLPLNDEIKAMMKEGYKFGFQVAILDDLDDDNLRDIKITWGESTDDVSVATWNNSAHCDEVVLVAAPTPPPETEAATPVDATAAAPVSTAAQTSDGVMSYIFLMLLAAGVSCYACTAFCTKKSLK